MGARWVELTGAGFRSELLWLLRVDHKSGSRHRGSFWPVWQRWLSRWIIVESKSGGSDPLEIGAARSSSESTCD